MDLGQRQGGEKCGGVEGGVILIMIYYASKIFSIK